uniref:Membrane protein n=1 Tax=uncultured Bacillota bacterium TaxID=344338 RepID=A0A650EP72_9FIRM|nr:membrane protein [uncultured Firmicutes bacterium]
MNKIKQKIIELFPGFLACAIFSILAQIANNFLSGMGITIGAALFAIGFGIIAGNTFLDRPVMDKGTKFSESRLLEYSIVLLGATLNMNDVISVGVGGLIFIIIQMTVTVIGAYWIGKLLKFGRKFSLLMCAGNAVCGSSAIGTVTPVVGANSEEKGLSITIVNVTGTFLMILLPLLAGLLYHHETLQTSALIGGVLQSIGQVVASAKFVNDEVVEMAAVFKIIRIIMLVGIAFVFSLMNTEDGQKLFSKKKAAETNHEKKKVKVGIPWFIIGFFILSIINSFHVVPIQTEGAIQYVSIIPTQVSAVAKLISNQFEIIALAAIGMRVKFKTLISEGPKAMLYGGMVGVLQTICAVGLIWFFIR